MTNGPFKMKRGAAPKFTDLGSSPAKDKKGEKHPHVDRSKRFHTQKEFEDWSEQHFDPKVVDEAKAARASSVATFKNSPAKDLQPGIEGRDRLPHNTAMEIKNQKENDDHQTKKHSPAKSEGHGAPKGHKHKEDIKKTKDSRIMKSHGITKSGGTYYSAGGDVISDADAKAMGL